MTYPDPNIGTSDFEHRSGPSSTATFKETPRLMLRPWFGKDDAYLRELRKKRDSMKGHLADRRDAARFQVIRTHFQLDASRRQVELYQKTLLPQAKQNLNTSLIAYRSAKVEFITLMDAARLWLNFNLSLHGAMRDYRKHYALLEQVIGKRLEEDRSQKTED
jgi:outer membrane protein TolC